MNILGLARHGLDSFEQVAIVGVVITAFLSSLLYAWLLRGRVLSKDKGLKTMQAVWNAIRTGAEGYLSRQLRVILPAHRLAGNRPVPERLGGFTER